jgi:hypothetical protein
LTDGDWRATPPERDPEYFPTWQRVSLALQAALRRWISQEYFADLERLESREAAFPMVVYRCSRAYHGKPHHEFTLDLRDCQDYAAMLAAVSARIGCHVQEELQTLERRLLDAGKAEMARRYAPVWHADAVFAARRKPRRLTQLLAAEAEIIQAVIQLGTERSPAAVNRSARTINAALRNVQGLDLRNLGVAVLQEATRALTDTSPCGVQNIVHGGAFEYGDVRSARRPQERICA